MNRAEKRKTYSPPQITKVILKREQAILSQCSVGITDPADPTFQFECYPVGGYPNGCKHGPSAAGDSGVNPS